MVSGSKALPAPPAGARGCLWLFGGIFIVAGGAMFCIFSLWPFIQSVRALSSWVETPCVIDSSTLLVVHGHDGDTYQPDIRYSYAFGDGDYEGNRYAFGSRSFSGGRRHQAVVDRYPPGSTSVCYVNPKARHQSVLTKEITFDYFAGFSALTFVGAGALVIFLGSRKFNRSIAKSKHEGTARNTFPDSAKGPVTLKPKSGRAGRFVGLTIFALIWNGIVGTVLYAFMYSGDSAGDRFVAYLVLIPFALVGVALMAGAGHSFLALFNPRVRLSVSHGAARLGSEVELSWKLVGAAYRIRELHLWLEGREEAKYTRGTDTYTDRHTFVTIEILRTSDKRMIRSGHRSVTIPEYTMHSFDGGNNKIIWEFKVEGEITYWPDVSNTFEYTVSPLALKEGQ